MNIYQKDRIFFLSYKKESEIVYTSSLINIREETDESVLEIVNRLLGEFQKDLPENLPEEIFLHHFNKKPSVGRFQYSDSSINYLELLLSSIKMDKIETEGSKYLTKQRILKMTLFYGVLFLAFFFSSKIYNYGINLGSGIYTSEIRDLSRELYEIELLKQDIQEKEKQLKEISGLSKNRSYYSHKIHKLAKFFRKNIWVRKISSKSDSSFLIEGFALNSSALDSFLKRIKSEKDIFVKPVSHELLRYKDLKKQKIVRYSKLVHFEMEINL